MTTRAEAYAALLTIGPARSSEVATCLGLTQPAVWRALEQLRECGAAERVGDLWRAVPGIADVELRHQLVRLAGGVEQVRRAVADASLG